MFEGEPSQRAVATRPQTLLTGMNRFLKNLDITFRRDPNNYRPRINKMDSVKDVEQKRSGASLRRFMPALTIDLTMICRQLFLPRGLDYPTRLNM